MVVVPSLSASARAVGAAPVNLAGYWERVPSGAPIGGELHVPTVVCGSTPGGALLAGIALWAAEGSARVDIGILARCEGRRAVYAPVVDIDGQRSTLRFPVLPRDRVVVTFSQGGNGSRVIMRDHGTKWHIDELHNEQPIDHSGAGVFADGCTAKGCAPIPPFSTFHFANVYINSGTIVAATRSSATARAGAVEAIVGPLYGPVPTHFAAKWRASCVPVAGRC